MKKNKKIISFIAAIMALSCPVSSWAYTFNVGPYSTSIDVNQILREANETGITNVTDRATESTEERYGIDENIWRNAQRKVSAPRMEIFFDNTNPKPGEKVTARAVPEFFKNDPQNLYYTWYIIHTRDGRPQTATNTISEGKREASKIMARGDYDPDLDGQDYDRPREDPDKDGWPSVDANSLDEDEDAAPMGGADGLGQNCFKHNFGTNTDTDSEDDSSGVDSSISCDHEWKSAPDYTSGSGKFTTGEEDYWKTDPVDPDTDGDGFPDEADVIGLGQDNFTWNYQPGDRVGVVTEGTSMIPIDEESAYFKIMWGHLDVCDSTKSQLLEDDDCDGSGDYGYGFLATKSPSEEGDDKLKISLAFSPDNPLADPSDENSENIESDGTITDADLITVASSIDNTNINPGDLYYTWQISKGNPQEDEWKEIKNISDNFSTSAPSSGMGISQFNFSPKKDVLSGSDDIIYFKVTLTVSKASDQKAGRGRSSVIIPVNTNGLKISLHKVNVAGGIATVGEEICTEGLYRTLCPVVKGQILAAKVSGSNYKSSDSEFSWKVGGNAVYPPANESELFDGWNKTTIFLPIIKDEQEIEDISVTASSKEELQPATGTRLATVVSPAVFIRSADTSVSWPKTYTAEDNLRPLSNNTFESPNAFDALTGSTPSYYLDFVPYYLLGEDANSTIDWALNGTDLTSVDFYENNPYLGSVELTNSDRTIKFPVDETEGAFTTLAASVKKYWSDEERNIAYSAWGIAPEMLSGSSTVSIETVNMKNEGSAASSQNSDQLLAAIGTHLPHYFMYLLRLVITMAVMFIVSSGFYGLTQRLSLSNEEK